MDDIKRAFSLILDGFGLLFSTLWHIVSHAVSTHKLQCALAVSVIVNILLVFYVYQAHAERDHSAKIAYSEELRADSLEILVQKN